jgi:hypothetical protein
VWRFYDPASWRVVVSWDAVFIEPGVLEQGVGGDGIRQ